MRDYVSRKYRVSSHKIPEGECLRIVLLADLHGKTGEDDGKTLLEDIGKLRPDLVLIAGDMILRKEISSFEKAGRLLVSLLDICPVFYGMGNHETLLYGPAQDYEKILGDSGTLHRILRMAGKYRARLKQVFRKPDYSEQRATFEKYMSFLETHGVTVLHNNRRQIQIRGIQLDIAGLELPMSYYGKPFSPALSAGSVKRLLGEAQKDVFQILISHDPKYSRCCFDWGADLTVSGHYHGGVWRLTGHQVLISPHFHPFPKFGCGDFHQGDRHLIVSAGLGEHTFPLRIRNPRELILIQCVGGTYGN